MNSEIEFSEIIEKITLFLFVIFILDVSIENTISSNPDLLRTSSALPITSAF